MFNNIQIVRKDNSGTVTQIMKVPLAYGPKQKWLSRLDADASLDTKVAITLPRLGFEIQNLAYDPTRKLNRVQKFKKVKSSSDDSNKLDSQFMPVPYNINMQLSILSKLNEDAIQILEQILPYFQPAFNLTVDLVDVIGEKRDMPITLEGIQMEDNYEDDYLTRRALVYTLNFVCKTYLFGPINNSTDGLIKKVQTDYYTETENLKIEISH